MRDLYPFLITLRQCLMRDKAFKDIQVTPGASLDSMRAMIAQTQDASKEERKDTKPEESKAVDGQSF